MTVSKREEADDLQGPASQVGAWLVCQGPSACTGTITEYIFQCIWLQFEIIHHHDFLRGGATVYVATWNDGKQ